MIFHFSLASFFHFHWHVQLQRGRTGWLREEREMPDGFMKTTFLIYAPLIAGNFPSLNPPPPLADAPAA